LTHKKVVIVGGGLAGLYASSLLEQHNIDYLLLEAKPSLGGRVLGAQSKHSSVHSYDLGPAWIFPHQHKLQRLIQQLGLALFEQYNQGDVLYQASQQQPITRIAGAGEHSLFKVKGGTQSLLLALENTLKPNSIKLNHVVSDIQRSDNKWYISANHQGIEKKFSCDELMLAMPPRIIAKMLSNSQDFSPTLLNSLQQTPTWMAGQAKCVLTYAKPFWRNEGLSGQLFSRVGPFVETYDSATTNDDNYALAGFIGWPAAHRAKMTEAQLKEACITQLATCFGEEVNDYQGCYLKDWAADPFIATEKDITEPSKHPEFALSKHMQELNSLCLHLVGSEFATNDPGYLEGAINAVDSSFNNLSLPIKNK
jgi:monoamine oxidase